MSHEAEVEPNNIDKALISFIDQLPESSQEILLDHLLDKLRPDRLPGHTHTGGRKPMAEILRLALQTNDWNQQTLAITAKLDPYFISRILSGNPITTIPSNIKRIGRMARALGIEECEIWTGRGIVK